MVDFYASFFHHLLELAVADRIRHVPTHTPEDDLPCKMTGFEIDHCGAPRRQLPPSYVRWGREHSFATEPFQVHCSAAVPSPSRKRGNSTTVKNPVFFSRAMRPSVSSQLPMMTTRLSF